MNEELTTSQTEEPTTVGAGALTAGAMLRRAREDVGLHVAALAVSMKIPVKKLEALEADRLDLLLDSVFVRALASSVCRTLKIDSAPILDKLPKNSAPSLSSGERGINAPFHTHGHSSGLSFPAFIAKPVVLVVSALLVGVVALLFFPDFQSSSPSKDADQLAVPVPVTPVSVDVTKPQSAVESGTVPETPQVVQQASTSSLPSVSLNPAQPVSAPVAVTVKEALVASPVVKTDSGSATTAVNAVVAPGLVVFKAKGATWVEVIDAKGIVQLRKTLSAGDVASASGALPLSVVIGRADVLEVEVKGKAFSLASIVKDNVARFEVK
jgi:cytoskeleton protein RodZ